MPTPTELWNFIRARRAVVPSFKKISSDRWLDQNSSIAPILPEKSYFAVVVDELFLENSTQWFQQVDPMVIAITEFVYDAKAVTLPFVIGPKLLGNHANKVPQGMLYRETRVAGVHPFRGGRVVSTIMLCQVSRLNYAREILKIVESVANAVPVAGALLTYSRYAEPLLDGIETLFGMDETTPLVGVRQEFDHDTGNPIAPAYYALIDGPEAKFPVNRFWVRDGRLLIGDREEDLVPFRDASYVLFSTRGVAEFGDLSSLSQHQSVKSVMDLAASPDEADWKRVKAELVVLLRQLITSADLIRDQALRYHESIVKEALRAHEYTIKIGKLSSQSKSEEQDELRRVVNLLDLP
jgi:hypothetical protein